MKKAGYSLLEMLFVLSLISIISISYFQFISTANQSSIKKSMEATLKLIIEQERLYFHKYDRFFSYHSQTEAKPEHVSIIIDDYTMININETLCEDSLYGFTISIVNSKINDLLNFNSCEDISFNSSNQLTYNELIELPGSNNFTFGNISFLNKEFDGINLSYNQAELYCQKLGARMPSLQEISSSYSSNPELFRNIFSFSSNYWTSDFYSFSFSNNIEYSQIFSSDLRFNIKCIK